MHYCVPHALGDTTVPSRGYERIHPKGKETIIMFYIMLSWRLLILTDVRPKELQEYARPTRKVTQ